MSTVNNWLKDLTKLGQLQGQLRTVTLAKTFDKYQPGRLTWCFYMFRLSNSLTNLDYDTFLKVEFGELHSEYDQWLDSLFDINIDELGV